jgi:hypothetical protein
MKRLIEIIPKVFTKEPPKPLGRWNIDYCSKKIDQKIDLSNEDHCGPCGQYVISKIHIPELKDKNITNQNVPSDI